MKKTLTALIFLAGVGSSAEAATSLTYWASNTGNDILTVDGVSLPYLGNGGYRLNSSEKVKLTTAGNTDYTLNFAVADRDQNSFAVNDAIYLNQITTSTDTISTQLSISFGSAGSLNCAGSVSFGAAMMAGKTDTTTGVTTPGALTLNVALSVAELNSLAAGTDVTRTLISTDHFDHKFSDFSGVLKLGAISGVTYGGVIFSVTSNGAVKYYSLDDAEASTKYIRPKTTAKELVLNDSTSYLVIGTDAHSQGLHSSMKRLSYVVTAPVPEPTTATLSLLALCGLVARRRR